MIIDGQEIFDQGKIANYFNKFFVDIAPKLASMTPESQTKLHQYLKPHKIFIGEPNLTDKEAKKGLTLIWVGFSGVCFEMGWG